MDSLSPHPNADFISPMIYYAITIGLLFLGCMSSNFKVGDSRDRFFDGEYSSFASRLGEGTIPVIMEERLSQVGNWLKVNGDAVYGTKPWKSTRQWSTGEVPKVNYNAEFETAYEVSKLVAKPEPGKAGIEVFSLRRAATCS